MALGPGLKICLAPSQVRAPVEAVPEVNPDTPAGGAKLRV
jgi:hypothetical protein